MYKWSKFLCIVILNQMIADFTIHNVFPDVFPSTFEYSVKLNSGNNITDLFLKLRNATVPMFWTQKYLLSHFSALSKSKIKSFFYTSKMKVINSKTIWNFFWSILRILDKSMPSQNSAHTRSSIRCVFCGFYSISNLTWPNLT